MGTLFFSSISFFTRLVASTDFSAPFCGALIIPLSQGESKLGGRLSSACKEKGPTYPVQCDHGREKSEKSCAPCVPYNGCYVPLIERDRQRRLPKTCFCVGEEREMCSCMRSCISMSALWTRCEGSRCVCILASVNFDMLIWKGSAGIIDTAATCGHVKGKLSTAWPPDTKKCSSLHGISCVHPLSLLGTFCEITAQGFSFLHQAPVRVTKLCSNICLQYHRLFNNPNHINDYSWSWLRLKIHPYCIWMATDCKIKCEFSATWNSVVSIL